MDQVVKEGFLEKQGMVKFMWKKYWFALEGNMLSYYKDETKKIPASGAVDMSKVQTVRKASSSSRGHEIEMFSRSKSFVLSAASAEDCNSWIELLQQAMQFQRRKSSLLSQRSFFSTSEDVPDDTYEECREEISHKPAATGTSEEDFDGTYAECRDVISNKPATGMSEEDFDGTYAECRDVISDKPATGTSEEDFDGTYAECRDVISDKPATGTSEEDSDVFYNEAESVKEGKQSKVESYVMCTPDGSEGSYAAIPENKPIRSPNTGLPTESMISECQGIYDSIRMSDIEYSEKSTGLSQANQMSEGQDIYDTIQEGEGVESCVYEEPVAAACTDTTEQTGLDEDTLESTGYDALSHKPLKSVIRNPGYTLVVPKHLREQDQEECGNSEADDESGVGSDTDSQDDATTLYDDIDQLLRPEPVPKLQPGPIEYSQAVKDMKNYLENNCTSSELFVPPALDGEEGKGIELLRKYLREAKSK